ncbi:ubiquitin carboxyl-terminal hydrolase 14 [Panicum miliaceum]|uniref:Ubiquitin carboxyl-terminal hydrolase n=1 Tax=Panicum miliaceum TaxID=4540 RepID=A0A3L6R0H8_PANMI|nr:ubiquitin carboxyl-terminal hydrolase 14 [Panicum miliaceum]
MDLLRSHLHKVRIPEPGNRIHKDECCASFDTPRSEGGLYVDMSSFLGFGREHVEWNFEKTGNPVYLHIVQRRKLAPDEADRPLKKPTLLAIGVEGGFGDQEPEYDNTFEIVILPDFISLPFPSVDLPEKVRLAVDKVILAESADRKQQLAAWVADKKKISAYAMDLQQLENGVIVPPTGWKCSKCDKTENLWLNLTDGMILCGRKLWDGSGGNNHAIEHYEQTKYPLAVKLGTITADLEAAGFNNGIPVNGRLEFTSYCSDVFSYPEDDSVEDPLLAQHLSHFGIDFSSLQKTEMTTAERELDANTNYDWNRIQESGKDAELLFGPGYTGLANLGNRYFEKQSLKAAFAAAPADPTMDLNMQMTKLGHGLLSGKYSAPNKEYANNDCLLVPSSIDCFLVASVVRVMHDQFTLLLDYRPTYWSAFAFDGRRLGQEGIRPRMFKSVIAANHSEFSSMRQQDALDFFLHLLDRVEQANPGNHELNPCSGFKFIIEERVQCPSGKVSYNKRSDYILSLSVPLHEATNKEQLEAFSEKKAAMDLDGKEVSNEEIVRPRVPLEACLASFSGPEEIPDFYSTALNSKTTATKTAGFNTFPDYLVLHMRKFVLEAGWVPKKLDVYIDVPDTIDISHMRSKGMQPGEELLPEGASGDNKAEPAAPVASEDIVSQLASMGFNYLHCQKAAINTSNTGVEEAMNWLLSHMDDPDINDPISNDSRASEQSVDEASVETLISFGFPEDVAIKALKASGGNIEQATDWIFSHPEASSSASADSSTSNVNADDTQVPDGSGRYKLMAFVSHMGTSTHCGHYVAHVLKDGRWAIFNDSKVAASVDLPKDMGYLYFFQRISG